MKLTKIIFSFSFLALLMVSCGSSNNNPTDTEAEIVAEEPSMEELHTHEHQNLEEGKDGYIGGTYKAENCEVILSIFPTDEANKFKFTFTVNGKDQIEGITSIENTESDLSFGDIGGTFNEENIVIQNYGNAMNEFNHFEICDDKYLELVFEGLG